MIFYRRGDATQPQGDGVKIITHVVNDLGGWGAGFVVAISRRWKAPEQAYRSWAKIGKNSEFGTFRLGNVQVIQVEPDLYVANMIAQRGYTDSSGPAIRYEALEACLEKVVIWAKHLNAKIAMPRIGCGLAGGQWDRVEDIIEKTMPNLDVSVYDL